MNKKLKQEIGKEHEYYNRRWKNQTYINSLKLIRCNKILELLIKTHIDTPKVIELGCGTGWLTSILGHIGPSLGIDLSSEAIENAKIRYLNALFMSGDILNLDHSIEQVDIIISHEVIEHVHDPIAYLNIAHQLLSQGGYLILTTPNANTMNSVSSKKRAEWSDQPIENWLTISELKDIIKSSGFEIEYANTIIYGAGKTGFRRIINSAKLRKVLIGLNLFNLYEKIVLKAGFGLHIIVMARKKSNSDSLPL